MPRAARADGQRLYDEHGNVAGGIRNPIVDVPIATYYGGGVSNMTACSNLGGRLPLTGLTEMFSAEKLAALYPTEADYVERFKASVTAALNAGFMLPEGAAEMIRRVETYGLPG